jgi:hypothetical protein
VTRSEELAEIDAWVAGNGVTRCEPRYASGVLDALPAHVVAQRLAALKLPSSVSYGWLAQSFVTTSRGL